MPASKAQQAATADRRSKAIALRLAGVDWQGIADQLGYANRGAAHTDVTRALKANLDAEAQQVDTLRSVEVQRLDRLQAAVWGKALKGDLKAIESVLKIVAQRCKVQGLEAPTRVSVEAESLGAEIGALLHELTGGGGDDDGP